MSIPVRVFVVFYLYLLIMLYDTCYSRDKILHYHLTDLVSCPLRGGRAFWSFHTFNDEHLPGRRN
jgi:hypothetical protein